MRSPPQLPERLAVVIGLTAAILATVFSVLLCGELLVLLWLCIRWLAESS